MSEAVFCIVGAIVGAGFASGREIMQFFSRYGTLSWLPVLFASAVMGLLIFLLTARKKENNDFRNRYVFHAPQILLYGTVAGSMAAAAGELTALTVPLRHARAFGTLLTLAGCAALSGRSLRGMALLGKLLIPGMAAAFLLILRLPHSQALPVKIQWQDVLLSFLHGTGYCGLNAALIASVASKAGKGKSKKERGKIALSSGLAFGALLALGNAALLPYAATLWDAALPVVTLLRSYGKKGYYLCALVLYLAVATTLIAALRGLREAFPGRRRGAWAALIAAMASMLGFQDIVAKGYPILGWFCLAGLLFSNFPYVLKQKNTAVR